MLAKRLEKMGTRRDDMMKEFAETLGILQDLKKVGVMDGYSTTDPSDHTQSIPSNLSRLERAQNIILDIEAIAR